MVERSAHYHSGPVVRRLAPLAGAMSHQLPVSIGRLLGDGARLLGRPEDTRHYYAQALEVRERIRFRPEVAPVHLALAHLEFAIAELRDMKMAASLERALPYKEPPSA